MKRRSIFVSLLVFLLSIDAFATSETVKIIGQVPRYTNKGHLILVEEKTHLHDTLMVDNNGRFECDIMIQEPTTVTLFLEYLGEDSGNVRCFLRPNCSLEIKITGIDEIIDLGERKLKVFRLNCFFKGETSKECTFLNLPPFPDFVRYKYADSQGKAVSYQDFIQQISKQQANHRKALKGTCEEFSCLYENDFKKLRPEWGFVYAWQLFKRGFDPGLDPGFNRFVNSIDLNNSQVESVIADYKIRYILKQSSTLYQDEPELVRYMRYLRDSLESKEMRERLSDEKMKTNMISGIGETLDKAWHLYTQLSGKSEIFKQNKKIYETLLSLKKGVKAGDFEIQDIDGNSIRFHDIINKGKITYIDFWATWCAPCCAEIPHLERLIKKYKDVPTIQFVSISLDKDIQKWKKRIADDKPEWEQYIIPNNFNSVFAKEYNVRAVPRFMTFDGEGRIININEERPSAENIEEILNGYIENYCK
ncbi:MAG: TlpA family protein disulfide reductase [Prevotella sp.]|nr:TlpA family protein disulfide reductase [Prevotella sp.]MBR1464344.1 TlpA family protein disulfide reductase [Prevotella sp.]